MRYNDKKERFIDAIIDDLNNKTKVEFHKGFRFHTFNIYFPYHTLQSGVKVKSPISEKFCNKVGAPIGFIKYINKIYGFNYKIYYDDSLPDELLDELLDLYNRHRKDIYFKVKEIESTLSVPLGIDSLDNL